MRLLFLILASCATAPSPIPAATPPAPSTAAAPKCRIEIDGRRRIWVDGWETQLAIPTLAAAHVSTFATGGRLFFAWATEDPDPRGSPTLYSATCAGIPAVDQVVTDPHVDFGHAALLGGTLVVTTETGAAALDVAAKQLRPITTAPACQRDVVVRVVHGGAIAIRRGGSCGGSWIGIRRA